MSSRPSRHKDVEYSVNDTDSIGKERIFKTPGEAAAYAVSLSMSDGRPYNLDVLVWSRAGAKWYRGPGGDGEMEYDEDPEASVFERIVIRADVIGRVA